MAKIGRRRLAREIVELLTEHPDRRDAIVQQLAAYLIDTKQARHLDLLMQDIADELYVQQKQLSAEVEYMFEPSQATQAAIIDLLKEATGAATVDIATRKNTTLLGGIVLRTPRQELDASVRRKLKIIAGGTT